MFVIKDNRTVLVILVSLPICMYVYVYIIYIYIYIYNYIYVQVSILYKNNKNIFKKMKENVGISKPKKHTNKIGMVP